LLVRKHGQRLGEAPGAERTRQAKAVNAISRLFMGGCSREDENGHIQGNRADLSMQDGRF
jgi:hypothetical protein